MKHKRQTGFSLGWGIINSSLVGQAKNAKNEIVTTRRKLPKLCEIFASIVPLLDHHWGDVDCQIEPRTSYDKPCLTGLACLPRLFHLAFQSPLKGRMLVRTSWATLSSGLSLLPSKVNRKDNSAASSSACLLLARLLVTSPAMAVTASARASLYMLPRSESALSLAIVDTMVISTFSAEAFPLGFWDSFLGASSASISLSESSDALKSMAFRSTLPAWKYYEVGFIRWCANISTVAQYDRTRAAPWLGAIHMWRCKESVCVILWPWLSLTACYSSVVMDQGARLACDYCYSRVERKGACVSH